MIDATEEHVYYEGYMKWYIETGRDDYYEDAILAYATYLYNELHRNDGIPNFRTLCERMEG